MAVVGEEVDWYVWQGSYLQVEVAHPDVRRFVCRYLAGFACTSAPAPHTASARLHIAVCRGQGWEIAYDTDRQVVEERDLLPVADLTVRRWLAAATHRQPAWQVFHAACLVYKHWAFGVLGDSGAGKSTLAMAWYGAGMDVLSDEYCLLDGNGQAHLYPRPWEISDHLGDPEVERGLAGCERFGYPYWRPGGRRSMAQYFVPKRVVEVPAVSMVAWVQLDANAADHRGAGYAGVGLLVQYPVYRVARCQPAHMVAEVVDLLERIV